MGLRENSKVATVARVAILAEYGDFVLQLIGFFYFPVNALCDSHIELLILVRNCW